MVHRVAVQKALFGYLNEMKIRNKFAPDDAVNEKVIFEIFFLFPFKFREFFNKIIDFDVDFFAGFQHSLHKLCNLCKKIKYLTPILWGITHFE